MQTGDPSSRSADANGDASHEADKGKRKGKTPKFERLRITGSSCERTQQVNHARKG